MNKLYYVLPVVIAGLVIWLVWDFLQNKTTADIISRTGGIIGVTPTNDKDNSPMVFPPPAQPKVNWVGMFSPKVEVEVTATDTATVKPNFILTGIILDPKSPKAFILVPARNNEERICGVGDIIDPGDTVNDWKVVKIVADNVIIENSKGEKFNLSLNKPSWPIANNPGQSPTTVFANELNNVLSKGDVKLPQGFTPEMVSGLLKGDSAAVKAQLEAVVQVLPPQYVRELITKLTDLAKEDIPAKDEDLPKYASRLFGMVSGDVPEAGSVPPEEMAFAKSVNSDNSPVAPQPTFKPSDRRLYATFPNKGGLQGLNKVVTRWKNLTTGDVEYAATKPIDPNAPSNFIWVEKPSGWPIGDYEVDLYRPQTMEKISGGTFSVAP